MRTPERGKSSHGTQIVSAAGTVGFVTVEAGGVQTVELFGGADGETISKGGIANISGTDENATICGGQEVVFAGGIDEKSTVANGGEALVSSGGLAEFNTVQRGGREIVSSGGIASNTTITGGILEIMSGGSTGTVATTFHQRRRHPAA